MTEPKYPTVGEYLKPAWNDELRRIEARHARVKQAKIDQELRNETVGHLIASLSSLPQDQLDTLVVTSMPFGAITDHTGIVHGFCATDLAYDICRAAKFWGKFIPTKL